MIGENVVNAVVALSPAILVLVLGYLTHRVMLSLILGIVLAAIIATKCQFLATATLLAEILWSNLFLNTYNLFICIFLLILGVFVNLLQHSGGVYAYGLFIKKFIKTPKDAETASLALSTSLFIDDYLSSLTVGSIMHPLTDSQKIPRAKLAFLVDSMAAPLAILCPFSSWVAAILGFLRDNGVSTHPVDTNIVIHITPMNAYLHILPFLFYSLLTICAVWYIVRARISYGLMREYESIARDTGNLFGGKTSKLLYTPHPTDSPTTLGDFFLPVICLLICVIAGMLWSGQWQGFGGERSLMAALQNSSAEQALFNGGLVALLFATSYLLLRKRVAVKNLVTIYSEGIKLMLPAIVILILAFSLGDLMRDQLKTGYYLASFLTDKINLHFLPPLFFFISFIISFAIGSSWGTAAMIFPIAIQLVLSMLGLEQATAISQVDILFPTLGATLSGCVAGDHISPISDTTVMSATSTRTHFMAHVNTQFPYALPVVLATALGFCFTSFMLPISYFAAIFIPLLIGIAAAVVALFFLNKL